MSDKVYPVPAEWAKRAFVDDAKYRELYQRSVDDPERLLGRARRSASTGSSPSPRSRTPASMPPVSIKWFEDGTLNVSANCIDRHLETRGDQVAIIWEGDDPDALARRSPIASSTRGLPLRQCPEGARRQEGRPRHHLHADDPGGGVTRCSPARASAPSIPSSSAASRPTASPAASTTATRALVITADEGRRGGKIIPLEAQRRRGARPDPRRREGAGRRATPAATCR